MSETNSVDPRRSIIGENLKRLLDERGLQAKALALHIHVSPQALSQWATGQLIPTSKRLHQIAEVLGVSVDELTRPRDAAPRISIKKVEVQLCPLEGVDTPRSVSERVVDAGEWEPSADMRSATAITMRDSNLEPHIRVGDELFVDMTWRAVSLAGLYLLDVGNFPLFRRCHLVDAGLVRVSDCHGQQDMKTDDLKVLGRAVKLLTRP